MDRSGQVLLQGSPSAPARLLRHDDPSGSILALSGSRPRITVPAESLLLAELAPAGVPLLGSGSRFLLWLGMMSATG